MKISIEKIEMFLTIKSPISAHFEDSPFTKYKSFLAMCSIATLLIIIVTL